MSAGGLISPAYILDFVLLHEFHVSAGVPFPFLTEIRCARNQSEVANYLGNWRAIFNWSKKLFQRSKTIFINFYNSWVNCYYRVPIIHYIDY